MLGKGQMELIGTIHDGNKVRMDFVAHATGVE